MANPTPSLPLSATQEDPRDMGTGQKQPLAAPGVSAWPPVYHGAVALPKMSGHFMD